MYRVQWRRPGCLGLLAYLVLSVMTSLVAYGLMNAAGEWRLSPWWILAIFVGTFVGLYQLHKLATRQHIPICPHCGTATNPQFRVSRACGREKAPGTN